jgi:glutamine amidotransferase
MKLGVVDLNTGNLASLLSALDRLNIKYVICRNSFDFEGVDKIILPGVGAFRDFMKKINDKNLNKILIEKEKKNASILGVCVGFQILFSSSNEHGDYEGLKLLKGNFINFKEKKNNIKVPHVGWNECNIINKNQLFNNIKNNSDFYFTHSYYLKDYEIKNVVSQTKYELDFVSSVNKGNVYGVQFHPEKSQSNGLQILKNFYERC